MGNHTPKPNALRLTIEPETGAGIKADRQLARFVKCLLRVYGWRLVRIETPTEARAATATDSQPAAGAATVRH
ncbi:MAG: hypothetical protein AAFU85_27190 [Planctomycetota bacterium]